jgi:hypothetical protein
MRADIARTAGHQNHGGLPGGVPGVSKESHLKFGEALKKAAYFTPKAVLSTA